MSLHRPSRIRSSVGLGLPGNDRQLKWQSEQLAIGTEIWREMDKPWQQDEIVIAQPGYVWRTRWEVGKPYIVNKYFSDKNELVGIYCDICRPVEKDGDGLAFDDLYLDVWQVPGRDPIVLDEDELADALAAGYISAEEAEWTEKQAQIVKQLLVTRPELLDF